MTTWPTTDFLVNLVTCILAGAISVVVFVGALFVLVQMFAWTINSIKDKWN